jgi:palmitoyltransferase
VPTIVSLSAGMAVNRSVKIDLEEPKDEKNLSLMEKWKRHVEKKKKTGQEARIAKYIITCLLVIQIPSQLYIFMCYIIPTLFFDVNAWIQYYLKVLIVICCLEFSANYLCVRFYGTVYRTSRDNPQPQEIHERWNNPPDKFVPLLLHCNGTVNGHVGDNHGAIPWTYCDICKMDIPPRAHHCNFCQGCVLKRDHHCFMVGTCIGFKNQRYFVVMSFYTMICGLFAAVFTIDHLNYTEWRNAPWSDFILPITVYRTVFGNIPFHIGLMIYHVYVELLFGALGVFYFISQMLIIAQGKTLYELAKDVPIRNSNTVNSNFVSVFGNFWAFNFLFPMQMIFRQGGNGTKWDGVKLDHNANYEKNVEIY